MVYFHQVKTSSILNPISSKHANGVTQSTSPFTVLKIIGFKYNKERITKMKEKRKESFARTMYDSAENLWQVGL
jgi:hypothetical protein